MRGKYRVLGMVGQGGMGEVYKAVHVNFGELRALKVMKPEVARDASFVRRFLHEAVITRRLQHPNAVRVEDVDESEDGRPFIVMEYIEGRSLKQVIGEEGALDPRRVAALIKQVASALAAAHALGMIHRDIKPENIVLVRSGGSETAKVLDFGIAKVREGGSSEQNLTMTKTGMMIGTPQYMSPEQAMGKRGDELDGRSDLYSLGVVMYQMLAGVLPFKADTTLGMLHAHVYEQPAPLNAQPLGKAVPPEIVSLVMRLIAKKPEDRPASAQAVIDELERMEKSCSDVATRVVRADNVPPASSCGALPQASAAEPGPGRRLDAGAASLQPSSLAAIPRVPGAFWIISFLLLIGLGLALKSVAMLFIVALILDLGVLGLWHVRIKMRAKKQGLAEVLAELRRRTRVHWTFWLVYEIAILGPMLASLLYSEFPSVMNLVIIGAIPALAGIWVYELLRWRARNRAQAHPERIPESLTKRKKWAVALILIAVPFVAGGSAVLVQNAWVAKKIEIQRHVGRAYDLLEKNDYDGVEREMRAAQALDPKNPLLHEDMAAALGTTERSAEAIAEYRTAIALSAGKPGLLSLYHVSIARIYEDKGNYTQAEEELRDGVRLLPADASLRAALARCHMEQGRVDEAIAELRAFPTANLLGSDAAEIEGALGAALERKGNLKEAADAYKAASEHYGGDSSYKANYEALLKRLK